MAYLSDQGQPTPAIVATLLLAIQQESAKMMELGPEGHQSVVSSGAVDLTVPQMDKLPSLMTLLGDRPSILATWDTL